MKGRIAVTILRLWHAVLAGGFVVAYATADEDTYAMHLFAGYVVLAAIVVRLALGLVAPAGSPLRLPRPKLWPVERRGRNPLFAWIAAALLGVIGLSAVTGALADGMTWLEDPHEAVSEFSLWVIFGHVVFVGFMYGGKRLLARMRETVAARY